MSSAALVGTAVVGEARVGSLEPEDWSGTYPAPALPPFRVSHRWDLLDRSGVLLGQLDGVLSGSLSRSAAASIKASASLSLVDTGQVTDWTQVRLRPVVTVNGTEWPLGVFLPDVPAQSFEGAQRLLDVALLDKTTILDGDSFGVTYGIEKGVNVAAAVRDIIESTGEPATGIEDTDDVLVTTIEAEPDDSKLAVINSLLDAANYFSLYTGGNGGFNADPYVKPARRPVSVEFIDGENARSVYLPDFTREQDVGSVPNRVRAVSQSGEDEPALSAEAVNTDPASPYSFDRLGYWRTLVETEVKTTSQASLQAYAERRLIEASSPQEVVEIEHPPYRVTINDVVSFTSREHGIDGLFTVTNQDWDLVFDGMVTSKLRKVVDL
ncbi:MAG: hypothetical protein L0G94_07195 [Brachybacterium sp.]|uniref:hypothetical protein n=1 Tax=Brachybacterium sp. TaxID=1891286 RepID=UPI002647ABF6|nr:hypothetical protein [Brachybacterium sp.]MDN5686456.1 hypothetical protein [Brachybacterium sp.]